MIQKIIPIAASITLIGSASLTAYADNMLDKDYIVREIWSDCWNGKGDDGLIFPEASYKHHILSEWVNDNYGDDNYDWSKVGQLNYNFKDYYDELTDNWNFNDDRDGNWTIITDETTYHFNLQNGKWLMSDDNGNVIDSFMPFSTLTEDTAEEIVIQLSLTMEKVLLTVSEKICKLKKIPRLVYQKKQQNQRVRKSPQMV